MYYMLKILSWIPEIMSSHPTFKELFVILEKHEVEIYWLFLVFALWPIKCEKVYLLNTIFCES